jgi:hypothetical protein
MFVCCECCVLSDKCLCDDLITCPEESYRLWCVVVCEIVVSNPTGGMDVCCDCRVLSGGGLCDELITRPEESYRLWCVVVCNLETSKMMGP